MTTKAPRKLPLVPIIVGLGTIALIATVLLTMSDTSSEFGDVSASGTALPMYSDGFDAAVGLPAPAITGNDFAGNEVRIDPADGRPKMLIFLAHWCEHCQAEVPVVVDWLAAGNKPDGLDIYAVATSTNSSRANYPPSKWLEREGLDLPTIVDSREYLAGNAYGLTAFPYWVLVAPDGTVVFRTAGRLPGEAITQLAEQLMTLAAPG